MISVLFVCHGNICRSPMAEFIFKDMVSKQGLSDRFYIASAATSTEEIWNGIGNPVYPPAREELAKHGIDCKGKRAVQLTKADYDKIIEKRIKNNLIIRFLESLFSRLIITKKLLNLDKKIYEFML